MVVVIYFYGTCWYDHLGSIRRSYQPMEHFSLNALEHGIFPALCFDLNLAGEPLVFFLSLRHLPQRPAVLGASCSIHHSAECGSAFGTFGLADVFFFKNCPP